MVLTERLCQEALDTFDPDEAEARRVAAAESRRVDVHPDAGRTGTVDVIASTDPADALDLETAVAQAAAELKAAGSTESLDVRRSMALGRDRPPLPRRRPQHRPRDRTAGEAPPGGDQRAPPGRRHRTLRHHPRPDQRRTSEVVVHPPRHPDHHRAHPRPQPAHPGRRLRGPRPARRPGHRTRRHLHAPLVHPTRPVLRQGPLPAYDRGGPPLRQHRAAVRAHHRAKTHDRWTYRFLRPGAYLWRSPDGHWYHRDGTGTLDLGRLTAA